MEGRREGARRKVRKYEGGKGDEEEEWEGK